MMLEKLIYSPLLEEQKEDFRGWDKSTIDYMVTNKSKIEQAIRASFNKRVKEKMSDYDVEDVYNEIIMYLYNVEDYNINKATNPETGNVASLENYVIFVVSMFVKRHLEKMFKGGYYDISLDNQNYQNETSEVFNFVGDKQAELDFDNVIMNLDDFCKQYQNERHIHGVDMYRLIYIRLLIMEKESDMGYEKTASLVGINDREAKRILAEALESEMLDNLMSAISIHGIERSIEILENYIPSVCNVRQAVDYMLEIGEAI